MVSLLKLKKGGEFFYFFRVLHIFLDLLLSFFEFPAKTVQSDSRKKKKFEREKCINQ